MTNGKDSIVENGKGNEENEEEEDEDHEPEDSDDTNQSESYLTNDEINNRQVTIPIFRRAISHHP
ncbi:hypothetical protein RO3G_01393 [Rhizopus delemar RA 99-880]|uniref:Uncharacterized protein n=1 Tax=Rhizopus delemar (strain RA 99-880 / ATCC MYA-4621 / FGSC 9543 / NRRL 43880) TaxID=246409 RepID=I1BKF9_RHIO9|nr:hypothetical protein RO3G_01393 [Rhizopus delemar RA 99-880]|eukprot:EIE76689.1 hypothetical protein RO3G_01393 [Rhizopus delemar RA 99-880]